MMHPTKFQVRPTLRGTLCLMITLAAFMAATNYQKNALHWLAYTSLAITVLGTLYSFWMARKVFWEWAQPESAFAGQPWELASNQKHLTGVFAQGDIKEAINEIVAQDIGLLSIRVSTWTTQYPLGLFKIRYTLPAPKPLWIYPQPVNHRVSMQTFVQEPEWTNVRPYQSGDRPKLLIKKTQALPVEHWQVRSRDDARVSSQLAATLLDWEQLPVHWTLMEKLQQMSYDVDQLGDTENFSLVLPHGHLPRGHGMPHKHHAWKLLAQEWEHWS